jgi:hypothetical protein
MHNKHELTTCKNDPRFETMQSRSSHVKGWIGTHTLKLPTTGPPHVSFLKLGAPQTTDGLSALKLQFGDMPHCQRTPSKFGFRGFKQQQLPAKTPMTSRFV